MAFSQGAAIFIEEETASTTRMTMFLLLPHTSRLPALSYKSLKIKYLKYNCLRWSGWNKILQGKNLPVERNGRQAAYTQLTP